MLNLRETFVILLRLSGKGLDVEFTFRKTLCHSPKDTLVKVDLVTSRELINAVDLGDPFVCNIQLLL